MDRGLRAHRRHAVGRPGRARRLHRLALPAAGSTPPSCFAALLGDTNNGQLAARPADAGGRKATRRRYRGDTLILESEWDTPHGTVRVTDFMPHPARQSRPGPDRGGRVGDGGHGAPRSGIRFDYGRIVPWVRRTDGQLQAVGGPDSVWLHSPVPLQGGDYAPQGDVQGLARATACRSCFTWHPSHEPSRVEIDPYEQLAETEALWAEWVAQCTYQGPWREAVVRSLHHAQGAHLRAHRRHRRRPHDLPARGHRRRSATGTTASAGCATPP